MSVRLRDETTGLIFDIKRYAIHDGPGIRTTVFFKGCPLNCPWCHNPESILDVPEISIRSNRCLSCGSCEAACKNGAVSREKKKFSTDMAKCVLCGACVDACPVGAREIIGRKLTLGEVLAGIERDIIFYDESGGGVTFSGGEPLMQPGFLKELLRGCKDREIHTALDTSCYAQWEVFEAVNEYVDLYLCDLKHMDAGLHERFTGVSNALILQNLKNLARLAKNIIIRIPVIPGVNDDHINMEETGRFVSSLEVVKRIDILPYHREGRDKLKWLNRDNNPLDITPPGTGNISAIAAEYENLGFTVKTGG
ncbi:Choline trimethylamine-lyase activating enzyme [subsurface metagenome]